MDMQSTNKADFKGRTQAVDISKGPRNHILINSKSDRQINFRSHYQAQYPDWETYVNDPTKAPFSIPRGDQVKFMTKSSYDVEINN